MSANCESLPIPPTMTWTGQVLRLLDQTRLPETEAYLEVADVHTLQECIRRLAVRGAPALGCAGAFGTVLIAWTLGAGELDAAWLAEFEGRCRQLSQTRPTAVNLSWGVERCCRRAQEFARAHPAAGGSRLAGVLEQEALSILAEDQEMCASIGRTGLALLRETLQGKNTVTLLTHCNAGALATGGCGTALAVMYAARQAGLKVTVFADETRPLLQGARLTAWELARTGIEVTVICDNMAAVVLRDRKVDAVIVGADRIAVNGDTANKIGTYGLAVLARHHRVPFYVAAPSSTFDPALPAGGAIPIEQRPRDEVARWGGQLTVPAQAAVFNPAFDVTPAHLITAHITETGIRRFITEER